MSQPVPKYLTDHFQEAFDSHQRLLEVIHVSRVSISRATAMPNLARALLSVKGAPDDDPRIVQAEKEAKFALAEADAGFPSLHSFAVVAIWSWLENLVKDLLARLLVHERKTLEHQLFQRISIKLSEYCKLNRTEQMGYLVEMLERETSSALKLGVNRFETLLEPVGLSGAVSKDTSQGIFELQQVRNVIAHRNGRCDRRLRAQCPWLKLRLGQKVQIGGKQFATYHLAASDYALEVLYRVGSRYNFDLRPTKGAEPPST